ncbi:DUF4367 domain-containing protein [Candidatus Microgenomates bacterium]|nr:DUF4367 domain-containing protein [Candidatus Microgenomates bacterium]
MTTPVKPTASTATAPTPQRTAVHVLDLSKSPKRHPKNRRRQDSPTAKHPPAHTLHGVRARTVKAVAAIGQPAPKVKVGPRHAIADSTHRHPKISRFGPGLHQPAGNTMTPHHSYVVHDQPLDSFPPVSASPAPLQRQDLAAIVDANQPKPKRKPSLRRKLAMQKRLAAVAAISLVVAILAGYVTYLNVPAVSVRVAAVRAGIDGQLPRYRPAGYKFSGPASYSDGQVSIRFVSAEDAGTLTLTERSSNWDPATLLENYVLIRSHNYIPFQQNGLTVYVYNGNSAAWINNGLMYTIEGSTTLSQDQVLKMAASL